jgi:hypothetical protein
MPEITMPASGARPQAIDMTKNNSANATTSRSVAGISILLRCGLVVVDVRRHG